MKKVPLEALIDIAETVRALRRHARLLRDSYGDNTDSTYRLRMQRAAEYNEQLASLMEKAQ